MSKNNNSDNGDRPIFPAKWASKLPDGWAEAAESMSADELKKKLVDCERTISSTEKDMENDSKLIEAKEEAKKIGSQYKEVITAHKAMVKYLVHVIDERGTP